jgi:hypothetical protein
VPDNSAARRPLAFVTSVGFGAIGLVLLVVGLAADTEAIYLSGVAAGVLSLIAALVWREELIMAWNARQKKRQA